MVEPMLKGHVYGQLLRYFEVRGLNRRRPIYHFWFTDIFTYVGSKCTVSVRNADSCAHGTCPLMDYSIWLKGRKQEC